MLKKIKIAAIAFAVIWILTDIVMTWYFVSGSYDFAADEPHWGWVENLIHDSVERSIDKRLSPTPVPPLNDPGVIAEGARGYDAMCADCHLKPGQQSSEIYAGLYPKPPKLWEGPAKDPKEAYYVIKHGIKMSGMPAWGPTHGEDEIWNLIAFLQALPKMTGPQYQDLVREGKPVRDVVITGSGEFPIRGSFFEAANPGPGVLMLHQCNAERSMYVELGKALSDAGVHALSIDYRGMGESVQEPYDVSAIRASATSREDYDEKVAAIRQLWPQDIQSAYDFLSGQEVVSGPIGVIGASCGGEQGLLLSWQRDISTLVFLSSNLSETSTNDAVHNFAGPILAIAASGDGPTAQAALRATQAARHGNSRLLMYKGDAHGFPLFQLDKGLQPRLVEWFSDQLGAEPAGHHHH